MDYFRLETFEDGGLIADLYAGSADVSIALVGEARYLISLDDHHGMRLEFALWTTRKGRIETQVADAADWAALEQDMHGNLCQLKAPKCLLHFEHLDRGLYRAGIDRAGENTIHINFMTPGYLKTKILTHVQPSVAS